MKVSKHIIKSVQNYESYEILKEILKGIFNEIRKDDMIYENDDDIKEEENDNENDNENNNHENQNNKQIKNKQKWADLQKLMECHRNELQNATQNQNVTHKTIKTVKFVCVCVWNFVICGCHFLYFIINLQKYFQTLFGTKKNVKKEKIKICCFFALLFF